jgi:hypothetical protein
MGFLDLTKTSNPFVFIFNLYPFQHKAGNSRIPQYQFLSYHNLKPTKLTIFQQNPIYQDYLECANKGYPFQHPEKKFLIRTGIKYEQYSQPLIPFNDLSPHEFGNDSLGRVFLPPQYFIQFLYPKHLLSLTPRQLQLKPAASLRILDHEYFLATVTGIAAPK